MNYPGGAYPNQAALKTQISAVTLAAAYAAAATFTTSLFSDGTNLDPTYKLNSTHVFQTLNLYITYTTGAAEAGTTLKFKVEVGCNSADLTDLFLGTTSDNSSGTITVNTIEYQRAGGAGSTTYKVNVSLKITDPVIKVSFKESGVNANFGVLTVKTMISQL